MMRTRVRLMQAGAGALALMLFPGLLSQVAIANSTPVGAISLPSPYILAENAYARGRMAEADKILGDAARFFGDTLTSDPSAMEAARRGYRYAVLAGDRAMAVRAAYRLDQAGQLTRDGTVLLLIDALEKRQWPEYMSRTDRIEAEENLAFLAPYLRSWLSVIRKDYVAPEMPTDKRMLAFVERYQPEQALLLAIARKDKVALDDAWSASRRELRLGLEQRALLAANVARMGRNDLALEIISSGSAGISQDEASDRLSRAKKLYRKRAVTAQYGVAMLINRLATDLKGQGDGIVAFSLARMACFIDPANEDARLNLAHAALIAGFEEVAIQEAASLPEKSPLWQDAQRIVARAMVEQSDYTAAEAIAQKLIVVDDNPRRGWRLLGDIYAHAEDYAAAADAYRNAVGSQTDVSLLLQLGASLEQSGDWESARPMLEKVVELAPDSAVALNHLGFALADRGEDVPRAITLLEKVHRLNPNEAAYIDSLGWAYFRAGRYAKALPLLERAVEMEPGHYELNEHLGDVLWAMGRRFEARHAWKAAMVALDDGDTKGADVRSRLEQKRDGIWVWEQTKRSAASAQGSKSAVPPAAPAVLLTDPVTDSAQ